MKKFSGTRLRKARERKDWSVSDFHYELAKQGFRVSLQAIRYWEKGERAPSSNYVMAFAKILGKDVKYFFAAEAEGRKPEVIEDRNCWIYLQDSPAKRRPKTAS